MSNVKHVTDGNFDAEVLQSQTPVLIDFFAEWCGPCKMMAPVFAATAQRLEPLLRFAKVDTEAAPELAARLGIRAIPTMILFEKGREKARLSGAVSGGDLERWIAQHLS